MLRFTLLHSTLHTVLAMTRLLLPLTAFVALAPLVSAGIKFISPAAGDKLTAGTAIEVEWEEGGTGPSISDLTTYQVILVAGGQKPEEQVSTEYRVHLVLSQSVTARCLSEHNADLLRRSLSRSSQRRVTLRLEATRLLPW